MSAGLCGCGCGQPTALAKQTDRRLGYVKGQPVPYLRGHNARMQPGYAGGQPKRSAGGYVQVHLPEHPRANAAGYVLEHIVVVEQALGKPLPDGAEVHHVDEDRTNNRNRNLVVCQDHAFHHLLHQRATALRECGHAGWRKCNYCKRYDAPENLYVRKRGGGAYHATCANEYNQRRKDEAAGCSAVRCLAGVSGAGHGG